MDNIKKQADSIIRAYFKLSALGATLNFADVTNQISGLTGVKSVHTVRTDIENVKLQGINFIYYNPVYPDINIESSSSSVTLDYFKYPYLNDADNFINKIEVITEDRSVY